MTSSTRKPPEPPLKEGDDLEAVDRIGPIEGDSREPATRASPLPYDVPSADKVEGPSLASTRVLPLPPVVTASLEFEDASKLCHLSKTATIIGRIESAADVVLPFSDEVSREHAAILYFAGEFFIEDLQSGNGTFVNGKRIERVRLRYGDRIRIGNQEMIFRVRI
jgi:pSer/pThr/pTyr-binding forkhead associated (FHA) protein